MLVHKGGKIKNWGGECRDVTSTKLQSQNILKDFIGGGGGSHLQNCSLKIYLKILLGGGGGGGSGWM